MIVIFRSKFLKSEGAIVPQTKEFVIVIQTKEVRITGKSYAT